MHKCITTRTDSSLPDLFTASWSPSQIDLCHFNVTVLAPLQWGHQTLSHFDPNIFCFVLENEENNAAQIVLVL
jgi:hypothetical protein